MYMKHHHNGCCRLFCLHMEENTNIIDHVDGGLLSFDFCLISAFYSNQITTSFYPDLHKRENDISISERFIYEQT